MAEVWGGGQAPIIPTKQNELVVIGSDFHVPYQDVGAVASFIKLVRALKPDRVILNGDIADFFGLSRFNIEKERIDSLQAEIDEANALRRSVRKAAPDAVLMEGEGNHDSRLVTFVRQKAKEIASLRDLQPRRQFMWDELEIKPFAGCGIRLRPDYLVKHGTLVRGEAGASAKAEHMASGISGVSGHVHRLATYRKAGYVPRQWTEGGCLCRLDPDYIVGAPNWTQGCVVVELARESFATYEVPYIDGKLRFGGKGY